jgi:hypothetical protein
MRKTCIAETNSLKPRYPCRLESAIAQTLSRNTVRQKNGATKINKPATARIQHLLEVGAGELGRAKELDGVGPRDATIPVYNARRLEQSRAQADEQDQKGIGDRRGVESDLSQPRRTTPGRSSGAPWSSCSTDTARSPWPGARRVTAPPLSPALARAPLYRRAKQTPTTWPHCVGTAFQRGFDYFTVEVGSTGKSCPLRGGWLEPTRGSCVCCAPLTTPGLVGAIPDRASAWTGSYFFFLF